MSAQMIFQRYECKYLLNKKQKAQILSAMEPYMKLDQYGRSTIRNIYFDTEQFRLIRRSLEKPVYKEKLRIRSYQQVGDRDPVFVELKKKYKSVVYKRRLILPWEEAEACFAHDLPLPVLSQIGEEIQYFRDFYQGLRPAVFLSYEREAYCQREPGDFRVTFDENILYRQQDLSLSQGVYGAPILPGDQTLMEIKTSGGLPLWMVKALGENHIYKTSFSKYGKAYCQILEEQQQGGHRYA